MGKFAEGGEKCVVKTRNWGPGAKVVVIQGSSEYPHAVNPLVRQVMIVIQLIINL